MNPPRLETGRARPSTPQGSAPREPRPAAILYRVHADRSHVERQGSAGETRLRVPLLGAVDEPWRRAYRLIQLDSTGYFRYRLELGSPVVTFTGRHADSDLGFFMNQLDAFLELVNARASLA
jgi:hypothetical protein